MDMTDVAPPGGSEFDTYALVEESQRPLTGADETEQYWFYCTQYLVKNLSLGNTILIPGF